MVLYSHLDMSNILNTYYAMYENLYTRQHVLLIYFNTYCRLIEQESRNKLGWL
ncbi:hypothetical protein HanRHA438_Chr15g0701111 [Helianthus annuus]|nr:hypothetical protein HanRHA438_Chr15g0701111 [Helianthus annuus]